MKLKLTLERPGSTGVDLVVTCDAATTVGQLARHLRDADPTRSVALPVGATPAPRQDCTLTVLGQGKRTLDARAPLAEAGVPSGARVSVSQASAAYADGQAEHVATVRVVAGPDAGREFGIGSGSSVVGRDRSCEVRLTDPMASRQHARFNVAGDVEVVDLGSSNGVQVNDLAVVRSTLRPSDRVQVGDTVLQVRANRSSATMGRVEAAAVGFIRSPRVFKAFEGQTFEAPDLPQRRTPQRFPVIALIAPVLMGVGLYFFTRNLASLAFIALSPIMMLGSYVEQRLAGRSVNKRELADFRQDVTDLVAEAEKLAVDEVALRQQEHPSTSEMAAAVERRTPLLWFRRAGEAGFGEFRLGLGAQASRSAVTLPSPKRAPRDLYAELRDATRHLSTVSSVPIVATPLLTGSMGVAGPRSAAAAAARAVVLQAAGLHSPNDMSIAVVASSRTAQDWDWAKWLPHCGTSASPLTASHVASTEGLAGALVGQIENLIAERAADREAAGTPIVFLVVESDAPVEFARLAGIAERGWRHGVITLWVASEPESLPASCRTFLSLTSMSDAQVGHAHQGELVTPVVAESLDLESSARLARALSAVVDLGIRTDDDSDLPRTVSLLSLTGPELADGPDAMLQRWTANRSIVRGPMAPSQPARKAGTLRAVIGRTAADLHAVDLRSDGPHALVGGTTGSGKSELLQTWILAMAANHSPQRLNFLLVDYKGGAAFAECRDLPHTVGMVTDLHPNGVRRALTSLAAELRFREHVISSQKGIKDLVGLERSGFIDAPPSLVIVVDEFAALVQEVPEFVDGVVNVAQRGRSLGLHLILATQRPAGVIKDNLRANTNLRLALRMADVDDSDNVLGSPQAAFFDPDLPGRAVSKTGPGRLMPFQAAYVGGHTGAAADPPRVSVEELGFGPRVLWEVEETEEIAPTDAADSAATVDSVETPTDIARIVSAAREAADAAQMEPPRKPWQPDLARHYDLADAAAVPPTRRDDALVFGVADQPERQAQPAVAFAPDEQGNMVVYGTGGSGKSTLLRSLAVAAGFTVRGGPCHVYGLDFSSHGLAILADLPHVGSVVAGSDDERVLRLLRWLRKTIDDRSPRYSALNAGSIGRYRAVANLPHEPRILLLIDGAAAMRTTYENSGRHALLDLLTSIASDGRPVGVHVVLSSDQRNGLSTSLASAVQRRVVMRMSDRDDYNMLGVPHDILTMDSAPGRAVVDGHEMQVAVLAPVRALPEGVTDGAETRALVARATDPQAQAEALKRFAAAMTAAGVVSAPRIEKLAEDVDLATLPAELDRIPLGIESESLAPCYVDASGVLVIAGPSGSGRSTALTSLVVGALRDVPGVSCHYFGPRPTSVSAEVPWATLSVGAESVARDAQALLDDLQGHAAHPRVHLAVIEAAPELVGTPADAVLERLLKAMAPHGHLALVEGETSAMLSAYGFVNVVKSARRGLVLRPDQSDGNGLVRSAFPKISRTDLLDGRGLYIDRGRTYVVQVARHTPALMKT